MTLHHISIDGDPYALGISLGRQGGAAFRDIVCNLDRFKALQGWRDSDRLSAIEAASRNAFPDLMREMDGIAAGADADFQDVLLWNCRGDLPDSSAIAGEQGCTDVMIPAQSATGLPAVIGHNEDDAPSLDGYCFIATARPGDSRTGFTSFCSPGLLPGHTFGVNDAGLVQTINHIRPCDQQVGIGRHIVARAVLGCRTMTDAAAILGRRDRAAGFHHNLGHCAGPFWAVEAPASGCEIILVETPRAHANHLVFDRFRDSDQEIAASSRDRQSRADRLLADDAVDPDPLAILGDSDGDGLPICRKRYGGPDSGYTLATAIFEIAADTVDWRIYDDPAGPAILEGRQSVPSND
jgi:Acyl-coenzyme A:6-aminopenicillanic acid acyl-transferase